MTQSAEIYTKSGWKQHEAVNAKYSGHLVMLCFFAPMFLIPLIGVSIYNRTNKHADAERILQLNQLIAPKSGRISNSEIAQNSKSLKEAILYLTANAQEALLRKDYERAANQFGLLTAIYRVLQDDKSGADNFYYLAHCQAAMKRYELARDNYARAIELYKGSTETQATSLLPRLTAELQAISGKTDENSK
jgi:tetratricopeptide (TPR) repeat protein